MKLLKSHRRKKKRKEPLRGPAFHYQNITVVTVSRRDETGKRDEMERLLSLRQDGWEAMRVHAAWKWVYEANAYCKG